jgi:hypothetical protein
MPSEQKQEVQAAAAALRSAVNNISDGATKTAMREVTERLFSAIAAAWGIDLRDNIVLPPVG